MECRKSPDGHHVPVAALDKKHRVLEVFCQYCAEDMTIEQHREYFKDRLVNNEFEINYDEPGDPSDTPSFVPEIKL